MFFCYALNVIQLLHVTSGSHKSFQSLATLVLFSVINVPLVMLCFQTNKPDDDDDVGKTASCSLWDLVKCAVCRDSWWHVNGSRLVAAALFAHFSCLLYDIVCWTKLTLSAFHCMLNLHISLLWSDIDNLCNVNWFVSDICGAPGFDTLVLCPAFTDFEFMNWSADGATGDTVCNSFILLLHVSFSVLCFDLWCCILPCILVVCLTASCKVG